MQEFTMVSSQAFHRCGKAIPDLVRIVLAGLFLALPLVGEVFVRTARGATTPSGDVSPLPISPNSSLQIGNQGVGSLLIDGGSTLASSFVQFGLSQSGIGTGTVSGAGSTWTMTGATVGNSGLGNLHLQNGGNVVVDGNGMTLGQSQSGNGTVIVENPGSLLQLTGTLSIGSSGVGVLRIADNAIVNAPNVSTQIGNQFGEGNSLVDRLEISNGLLRTGSLTNYGVLTGFGEVDVLSTSSWQNYGRLEANGGRLLLGGPASGTIQNNGSITAAGAELEFTKTVNNVHSNSNPGQIELHNGTLRFPVIGTTQNGLTNTGVFAATGGVNDVFGRIENDTNGTIAVTNDSVVTFHHSVTSNGGTVSVFAGSKAVFLQDLVMNQGAVLLADLAGATGDGAFGRVEVVGNTQLSGASLQVALSDGFTPQLGDTFPLIASAGAIQGVPSLGQLPALPAGRAWRLSTDSHTVELSVVAPLTGDYNGNGIVDAADYLTWRSSLGQIGAGLAADGNHDNVVDSADYGVWTANFGASYSGSGASTKSAEIPEPTASLLGIVGLTMLIGCATLNRQRRQS